MAVLCVCIGHVTLVERAPWKKYKSDKHELLQTYSALAIATD